MSQLFVSVTDNCSDLTIDDVYITSVSSDEEEDANGNGDGKTLNDIVIESFCSSVDLRKERNGNGNGRVYTINLAVYDENGNIGTATCQVHVPHSNNKPAIDDGLAYFEECDKSSLITFNGDCSANELSEPVQRKYHHLLRNNQNRKYHSESVQYFWQACGYTV